MDTTGRRQNPDEISTAALRYALGDHDGRSAQLDRLAAAKNPDIPVPATPGDHVRITAGHLTGHTGTVRPWTEAPDSRDAYAPAVSPDSHAAVKLDGETADTWAYIAHENLRRIESDPDEPDHFAEDIEAHRLAHLDDGQATRPFRVGDRVRISGWGSHGPHEGTVTRIDPADLAGTFGPYIATDCQYTADSGARATACAAMTDDLTAGLGCTVELIEPAPEGEPADIGEDDVDRVDPEAPTSMVVPVPGDQVLMADGGTARVTARRMEGDVLSLQVQRPRMGYAEWVGVEAIVGVPEPEGEPADIGEDDGQAPRPFQVGDEVLIDGEPGVIVEMRDEVLRGVAGVHLLAEMTGFPFPAWDAVRLTPDRTRAADGRQIELAYPARCTSRHAGIQCDLPVHEGLHAEGEDGYIWNDRGVLIEAPVWDDERHIWVDDAETSRIDLGWGDFSMVDIWAAIRSGESSTVDFKVMDVLDLARPPAEVAAMLRRVADVLDGGAK